MKSPAVFLIGAGPGDPGLITVRGLECLRAADVVIYDHLVSPRLLAYAKPGAELIDAGTAAPSVTAQEAISYLVAEKAREGRIVARLKWGDPFVFDRGGEEALFLHEQGIPFEVVPGIPPGIAVPAYAGVPVTYPRGGDTLTLLRGYEDERRTPPPLDWSSLVRLGGTIVCYGSAQQIPRILDALCAHGWPEDDSALVVYNGTLPSQEAVAGTVANLSSAVKAHSRREAAILVVGRVVALREHLRWFDARPLSGRRIVVTRPKDQAAELTDRLTALGAEVIEAPMIRIVPPDNPEPLRRAASRPEAFDCIVFTSGNAVEAFMNALLTQHRDVRALKGPLLCAVGSGTADRLARYGIVVDLVPDEFRAEAVVAALAAARPLEGLRVLLPRADIGREVIADQLRKAGAIVTAVVAYRTVLDEAARDREPDVYRMLLDRRIDAVTFTSASAVRNFARIYGTEQAADLLRGTVVATIGPVTAEAAAQLGITVTVQPSTYTIAALVEALAAHFSATASGSATS